ncbi:hypothetical protein BGZ94_004540, partial [Podila epigama]
MASITRTCLVRSSLSLLPKSSCGRRAFATSPVSKESSETNKDNTGAQTDAVPPLRLSREQRAILEEMIRIDQAGELGANWIYRGQYAVLGSDKKVGPLLE